MTFNSVNLLNWTRTISGIEQTVTTDTFHPAGSVWDAPVDTGERVQSVISIQFEYDGAAGSPNVTCSLGTSATLLITIATGQTVTGTFIVTKVSPGLSQGNADTLSVDFTPTGTITVDYTT